ncbi:MAG: hypothetical protein IJA17_09795 [Oscillospiraceae bacterium]|nr:hypothetical protein [Oscillospiraceae bacterium]
MVSKSHAKRRQDIKTKLMAAIAMLLVSSIMMVSSTYAWFTLSTAPEVTGITTQVGANGNLEMALLPADVNGTSTLDAEGYGITSDVNNSMYDGNGALRDNIKAANITWGNLVDVSDASYGLDKLKLYPAALNITGQNTDGNDVIGTTNILKTPVYGADGRVIEVTPNTVAGTLAQNGAAFYANTEYGVRAVGVASGMTERQLAFSSAAGNAKSSMEQARTAIVNSLRANGSDMANLAVKHANNGDAEGYSKAEVGKVVTAVKDLRAVVNHVDTAYKNAVLALAASALTGTEDVVYEYVKGLVEAESSTFPGVAAAITNGTGLTEGATIPAEISTALNTYVSYYNSLESAVTAAEGNIPAGFDAAAEDTKYTWADVRAVMDPLMNTEEMTFNGLTIDEVKADISGFANSVLANNNSVTLLMSDGSGVYETLADHVGDYNADITISVVVIEGSEPMSVNGILKTKSNVDEAGNPYVQDFINVAKAGGAPSSGNAAENPITEYYGYIIDLAFRTNAANSNLLIQQEGVDRIYSDNTDATAATMGHGASMTFSATVGFSEAKMIELMKHIKIVFFRPDSGEVVTYAQLDMANAQQTAEGITAKIMLIGDGSYVKEAYNAQSGKTYYTKETVPTEYGLTTDAEINEDTTYYTRSDAEPYTYTEVDSPVVEDIATYYVVTASEDKYTAITGAPADGVDVYVLSEKTDIMPLQQNTIELLSVLVYLDGETVTNAEVGTGTTSMTGTMNLQFASDATLDPMDYAALNPNLAPSTPATPGNDEGEGEGN